MTKHERLEILQKQFGLMNDFAKFLGVMLLSCIAISALAYPTWINGKLKELGIKLGGGNFLGIEFVAIETVKASVDSLDVANALTTAEIRLTNIMSTLDAARVTVNSPANSRAEVESALKNIRSAQKSLDEQATSLTKTGNEVGVARSIPTTGWVYVGYYAEDTSLRRLSDRLERTGQVQQSREDLKEIVLAYDAPVVSDGNVCNKVDISAVPMPDLNAPEKTYAIVRASPSPLKVLSQVRCPGAGKGTTVYAEVVVPRDKVRFSKLSKVVKS